MPPPNALDATKEMIESHQWVDIGENATWWGGVPNQPTCQTRPQAKPTRIDGILASRGAVPWISEFSVEKHDMIPTHSILEMTLEAKAAIKERTYSTKKKLRSLKAIFLEKVETLT